MKKIKNFIDKFLGNNRKFDKADSIYRKVYVLNSILIITALTCFLYVLINIFIFQMYIAATVNAVSALLASITLMYFKKTNNYKFASHTAVTILILWMIAFFYVVQNKHYAFYWLVILPPIMYFLLERKTARIILMLLSGYMIFFILYNKPNWEPSVFDGQSVFNIAGATLCLVLMLVSFEKSRKEAYDSLKEANIKLDNKQNELRLILDSAAEAIYGIDLQGNCTFCNKSCIDMLGYNDQSQLLGKNMHWQIHHSHKDGTKFLIEDCKIFKAFLNGEKTHMDEEVFWRADGSFFDVEYFSYPQIIRGEIIGAVITFRDITERKQKEAEIQYLSCYDMLTGLHNRRCFEENRSKIDNADNLPLSVIFADINGLKLTNDIFGHTAGDKLIKKSADILKKACRGKDLIARVGGDEFIILLPRTAKENAQKILERIKTKFEKERIEAIKCSISLGLDTKNDSKKKLDEIMANAENAMYKDKTINRKFINKDIIDTIINTLHTKNPRERQHSLNVAELCLKTGEALNLPQTEINKLSRAGYLHDIGKIVLDYNILDKEAVSDEEKEKMQQHTVIGYRILSLFDDTLDLAEYVYGHHERWNGKGYPRGLKGEQIPLLSRIITVAETYERVLYNQSIPYNKRKQTAVDKITEGENTLFDPKIVKAFVKIIEEDNEDT